MKCVAISDTDIGVQISRECIDKSVIRDKATPRWCGRFLLK